jgi:hypothetical protein
MGGSGCGSPTPSPPPLGSSSRGGGMGPRFIGATMPPWVKLPTQSLGGLATPEMNIIGSRTQHTNFKRVQIHYDLYVR